MKRAVLIFLSTCAAALAADVVFKPYPLPDVKASLDIPEGWVATTEAEDGIFVYHFGKSGAEASTAITLSVTTKVPERAEQSPAEYAAALIDMSTDDSLSANIVKGDFQGLKSIRCEYDFESDTGKMRAVNIALANDKSGTLYFFAWQAPLDESAEIEAVREKILASAKFDPSF